jgi:polyphosphate kinase 2 (PPK2 family)
MAQGGSAAVDSPLRFPLMEDTAREDPKVVTKGEYEKELIRLQTELVRMQEWIVHDGLRVMVIFEGRDTAGKGGLAQFIVTVLRGIPLLRFLGHTATPSTYLVAVKSAR